MSSIVDFSKKLSECNVNNKNANNKKVKEEFRITGGTLHPNSNISVEYMHYNQQVAVVDFSSKSKFPVYLPQLRL